MYDVAAGISGACLMGHGMNNAQKRIGECHPRQTLCIVHAVTGSHISMIGIC